MPRKYPRPDADIERLAAEFRGRWVPADGIEPWLRRNVASLRRKNRDEGWSWSDIGRALTRAGVVYSGGTAWTGKVLTVKVAQVRAQTRKREAKRAAVSAPLPSPEAVPAPSSIQTAPQPLSATAPPAEGDSEPPPIFELASLASSEFMPSKPSKDSSGTGKPSSTPTPVDVDEVIRRLQGGDAASDSEE